VVGGHQRYKIMVNELGHTELQVSVVNLDEQQEKLLNIALTKVSGDRDEEALKICIKLILVKWIADIKRK
jgi:uncharacterized membrane protein YqjE